MTITLRNHQRAVPFDARWLRRIARLALDEVLPHPAVSSSPLTRLDELEISIVSDAAISKVHQDFMNIPGATDVITFEHGEILISAETASRNAARYQQKIEHELALYVIHGILHLHGYEDENIADAARMKKLQRRILRRLLRSERATA